MKGNSFGQQNGTNFATKKLLFIRSMERFAGSLPVKGYSGEFSGKKRVQLPSEREKGANVL